MIKKFIDPEVEFHFVSWPGTELTSEDGIPFDFPGVELGHHEGKCTFETLIEKYNLSDPVLEDMAKIVKLAAFIKKRATSHVERLVGMAEEAA